MTVRRSRPQLAARIARLGGPRGERQMRRLAGALRLRLNANADAELEGRMQEHATAIIGEVERRAGDMTAGQALAALRALSLEDFGALMFALPHPDFPRISAVLPAMASAEIQKSWTGTSGDDLLRQTLAFTRQLAVNSVHYAGKPLQDAEILDFGCGYGRFVRMLYYFTAPENIWAVDAWDRSLEKCREVGLLGSLALSEQRPEMLPTGEARFDFGFAFSIFTHLSPPTATACLAAIRKAMKPGGVFVATIRPPEFWTYIDGVRGTTNAPGLIADHKRQGYAYLPHGGAEGEHYGDISVTLDWMEKPGWKLLGYDSYRGDALQISAILRAV